MERLLALTLAFAPAALAHDDRDSWVVVRGDKSATMHGDISDLESARKHLKDLGPGYLWFRRDAKQYLVRDGKVLEAIEEAVKPQEELSPAQEVLGREQEKIGREQEKMGRQQEKLAKQVQRKVEQLIEASLRNGSATPVQ